MDLNEEQKLVESAKVDNDSFGKLYDYYFPKVYSFVASKVYSRDEAEDMVSEIFVKIIENIGKFEWRGLPFGAWVFRIVRNTLNDYFGKTSRRKISDIEEVYDLHEDEEKTSPHRKAAQGELSEKVKKLFGELPERDLQIVQMKFYAELNNREISKVTGVSESNVAVIIYRTLQKLKPDLKYFL